MASQPNVPPRSRGYSLYERQLKLNAPDSSKPIDLDAPSISKPLPPLKISQSLASTHIPTSSLTHNQHSYSPILPHRRSPSSTESYAHTNNNNVQLISVQPRVESTYYKETPLSPSVPKTLSSKFLETDFPLYENVDNEEIESTAVIEKAFDFIQHDDDDDVIHQTSFNEQASDNDSFDDETEDILDRTRSIPDDQNDSGNHTLSSSTTNDKRNDNNNKNISQEKLNEQTALMAQLSRTTVSEEYDSDFDDSSDEDSKQLSRTVSINDYDEKEQQQQIIARQQQILLGIVQEWLRKEEFYTEQLKKMEEQLNLVSIPSNFQNLVVQLSTQHKRIHHEIEDLRNRHYQPASLTKQLTHKVEILMDTLPIYNEYIRYNLSPIRKSLDKRTNINGLPSEDLLSIPPKQFLQILSQVQDLYQTARSFESDDTENMTQLYNCAQRCRLYGSQQDENINKVILKNEDVVIMSSRGNRDRCRLILYPDAIVCCNLKSKLLTSPKYSLLWFIPILDLQWTIPQSSSDDNNDTGGNLKTTLKSSYKELERTTKTNNLTKKIREQEKEFHLSQSKLQLILTNVSRSSIPSTILFSSDYQRQDWTISIDKTKQELSQRESATLKQLTNHQRPNDNVIQKRLDIIKPILHDVNPHESPTNIQTTSPTKTYSGTLSITIHSIHGSALYNSGRQCQTLPLMSATQQQTQKNCQFYVAVEIDSYNTFYPYAQTSKQFMQEHETVEYKGEAFQVELEHSLAFRLLIYRIDTSNGSTSSSLQRATCIGKFHRDIEPALRDCQRSSNGIIFIESQSGDLKLKTSLKYLQRDGTFKRQGSRKSLAVFGRSIDKLLAVPNGLIDGIPRIIVKCIEFVERDGLTETGIYRVCCVASDLQKLRHEFDKNSRRAEEILTQKNVHVPANLLKLFFRELPEPLFTSGLYKQFLHAIQLTDTDYQRVTLSNTFDQLNADNRKILFYLFDHLIRVSKHSNINMMHLDNLAVVFGPTLMRPSKLILTTCYSNDNQRLNTTNGGATQTDLDQMSSELQGSMYQCQVVLACLKLRRDGILK